MEKLTWFEKTDGADYQRIVRHAFCNVSDQRITHTDLEEMNRNTINFKRSRQPKYLKNKSPKGQGF